MPPRSESLLVKWSYPVGGGLIGFFTVCAANYYRRRPYISGIQKHIMYTLGGSALGTYSARKMEASYAERDAMIRHYMELHPEDFIEERRKYRDIFEPWAPHR